MEMITAIALLCQLSFGLGHGDKSGYTRDAFETAMYKVEEYQTSCQKQLAKCILKKDKNKTEFKQSSVLECINERWFLGQAARWLFW